MNYQAKIISGNIGSVTNELNKFLEFINQIISMTQSYSGGILILTIIYTPKEGKKIPLNESVDAYDIGIE